MTSAAADLSRIADPNAPRDRSALITFDGQAELENITYGELDGRIEDVAARLRSIGCGAGSPVALLGETSAATMIVSLGIMRAGGVLVSINHKLPIVDQEKIIRHSECDLLIHSELFADSIPGNIRSSLSFEELVAAVSADNQLSPADRAMIMYTSGSSGTPKGVPLTHDGYLWAMERFDFLGEVIRGRATLIAAPLFHMNGQFHALSVLMLGGTAVMLPTFSAATYLDAARNYEAARLTGVPTMFELCARHIEQTDGEPITSVLSVGMGSAPFAPSLIDRLQAVFPNATISNGYGTTEIGPATFGPHPDGLATPQTSIGYPMPGVETRLRGRPSSDQGELLMKTGMQTKGYLGRPDLTDKVFDNGWYTTGDIMRRDEDGFFFFEGRVDDMFVSGGENIHPASVERTVLSHPSVKEVAVVPLEDPMKGAVPVAFVVGDVDPDELKSFSLEHGPAYAHPRFIEVMSELPLAGTNKIDRRALKSRAAERFGGLRS